MGDFYGSRKLLKNPKWVKHRKEIFDRQVNLSSGTGTKRTMQTVGQLGHCPHRKKARLLRD